MLRPPSIAMPEIERAYAGRAACVTGGAGFIGAHLVEALVDLGADVSVIDDLTTGLRESLAAVGERVRFVAGSVLDARTLGEAADGAEVIFHLAALTSVPGSLERPDRYHEVNATGTLRVLEAAREARPAGARVVYAASSSAYGDQERLPQVETMAPCPASPYAASKCAGEHLVAAFARCFGVPGVSLRYFNIFGPRQRPDGPYAAVIPRFARALLGGRRPTIYGDGSQTRDFTHVANAIHANLLAGSCAKPLTGQVVNVACGRSVSVLELLRIIAGLAGAEPDFDSAPPRVGEVTHSRADVSAAGRLLGYRPVVDLEEGLADALAWYRAGAPA